MSRVLERLEVRNGPTGSTDTSIVDIIPDVISAVTSQEVDGRETYRVGIPVLSTAWSNLVERQVLKNIMSDGTVDSEWRIMSLKSQRVPGQLNGTIECESIKYDLDNTLVSRTEANGDVNNYFELYGLTPMQHLEVILADAPSQFSVGTIASSAPIDMVYDWDNALSAAAEIATLANLEVSVDLTSTGYKVNMPVAIGSTASKAYLRYSRNIRGLGRDSDARTNQGTRVYPRGGGDVGDRLKIAEAAWLVTSVSAGAATLSTADGRAIAFDNQLNGLWVEEPGGTRKQVTDSTTGQSIVIGAGHGISTGERVKFRTSSGGDQLTYLEDPAQVATYGSVQRVFDRQDIPRVDNFVENPFFTGTYTAGVPTNWSKVGVVTFAESTSSLFRRYGNKSLHITATSSGRGVISDATIITPSSASPFFSVETAIWVVSGSVKLELIDQSSTSGDTFPPTNSEPAKTTVVGQWVDNLAVAGIDLNERSSTAVKMQVTALSTGGAEWYMDAAQVTQTAGGGDALYGGRASNALWVAGNAFLADNAAPRVSFRVSADDLERLHPTEFTNAKLVLGGTVQVVDTDMGLDFQTRIINLQRDLLHPGASQITLSNRPEDLSGLGIPGRRGPIDRVQTGSTKPRPDRQPSVKVQATRSGETVTARLDVIDAIVSTRSVATIRYKLREGDGSISGSWLNTWTTSTGTEGAADILTRTKSVTASEGKDSEFLWRIEYTDQNGATQTLGDSVSMGNLEEVAKTIRLAPMDMMARKNDDSYFINSAGTSLGVPSGAESTFAKTVGFPPSVGLTKLVGSARVANAGTTALLDGSITLRFTSITGSNSTSRLANIVFSSSSPGFQESTASLSETIATTKSYSAKVIIDDNSIVADGFVKFLWMTFHYDMPSYSNTY